ncbi:MAG: hypothetical protein EOS30_29270 [Mesorhizobium sp.]|nr:MAG: hypothetical protein EOS30_29270 [Mesorhizobium sp.]
MTDSRARDILSRQSELETERSQYEAVWEQVAEFCDPDAPDIWNGRRAGGPDSQAERQERRGSRVYANTINSAANRLAAGLESLIIPQSEKWHGLSTAAMNDEETDEEKEWAESLRDFLFSLRYSANSNFVPATQACLRNVVRYGPAYLYAEEGFGGTLIRYASIPVVEGYLCRNRWGQVDIFHRRYERTARQAAQLLGYEKLPARIKVLVDDPAKCEEKISLIQCIQPRDERQLYGQGGRTQYLDMAFASYHVIEDEEEIVRESGFRTFPVSTFNWRRYEGDPYGVSGMLGAIDFDDRLLLWAREVDNVTRDRKLSPEAEPHQPVRPQLVPELQFCIGHDLAHGFGVQALSGRQWRMRQCGSPRVITVGALRRPPLSCRTSPPRGGRLAASPPASQQLPL